MPNHKNIKMRTTWLILLAMVLAGIAMYYVANRKKTAAPSDTISLLNTPDSIRQRLRLFVAYDPAEITYRDSAWYEHDSIPLKEIPLDRPHISLNKQYANATLYIDYGHQWFYDVAVNKPMPGTAYELTLSVNNVADTLRAQAVISDPDRGQLRLSGPMMKMYNAFLLTYSDKVPPSTDSTAAGTPPMPPAARLITVIKK